MNRLFLPMATLLSGLLPLIIDSTLKGAALLALAGVAALLLYKASAAARHLVWLVAVLSLLLVPVFSVALPEWRVLPGWGRAPSGETTAPDTVAETRTTGVPAFPEPAESGFPFLLEVSDPAITPAPSLTTDPSSAETTVSPPPMSISWVPLAWSVGCGLLLLRLFAAHMLLRRATRRCRMPTPDDPVMETFAATCAELGLRRNAILLLDDRRTIPVVWGVLRARLLLPAEAREWSGEQLRSVLLHELAHLKRRDPLVMWVSQIACALHWWNPLVWLAAWRLHVERERACDDLVLASGVRPSSYAEHLLEVATELSPARWTSACGLAMARKSSLESRLAAVLSSGQNRRRVSARLAGGALAIGACIAVPLAMLRAEDSPSEPPPDPPAAAEMKPKHEEAGKLLEKWQSFARTDGKIPGALVGQLGEMVEYFIELNREDGDRGRALSERFEKLLPRFDAGRDWALSEVVALLDEVSEVHTIPLHNLLDASAAGAVMTGSPLPPELKTAPWGPSDPSGLRAAYQLNPRKKAYPEKSAVAARVLVHNAGTDTVFFVMPSWQQSHAHAAQNADGTAIKITSTSWTTMATRHTYRLAPGHYCETATVGIGLAADHEDGEKKGSNNVRVGSWLDVKSGDEVRLAPGEIEVRFSPSVVGTRMFRGKPLNVDPKDAADLWRTAVAERVAPFRPVPGNAADREHILRRLVRDLFGDEPGDAEIAAFVADAGANLEETLLKRTGVVPFTGKLPPGEIRFRVTDADGQAAAAQRPREDLVAHGPGTYELGAEAKLRIAEQSATIVSAETSYEIALPDSKVYAFAWRRGTSVLYLLARDALRKFDFADRDNITDSPLKPEETDALNLDLQLKMVDAYCGAVGAVSGTQWPHPSPLLPSPGLKAGTGAEREAAAAASKVFWGSRIEAEGLLYNPGEPFDPRELTTLAKSASSLKYPQSRRLAKLLSRAGAEKAIQFRYLLDDPEMAKFRDATKYPAGEDGVVEERAIALALAGYDYSVNGNKAALQSILDFLATERTGSDAAAIGPMAFIDEWDTTIAAYEKHFSRGVDGAAGMSAGLFWSIRQCLFPGNFDRFRAGKRAAKSSGNAKAGTELKPATVRILKWGEPSQGLRMALAWPPTLGEPALGDAGEFHLAVQNVSDEAVRLVANAGAPNPRTLWIREDGRILQGLSDNEPVPGDWLLRPREVAFFLVHSAKFETLEEPTLGEVIEATARTNPGFSLTAEMTIETAPEGAWTGKLRTGETRGSADVIPPRHESAQVLYTSWTRAARADGKIPGALMGRLAESVRTFIRHNPSSKATPQLERMLPLFDASHDWIAQEAVGLLDELAGVQSSPISAAAEHEDHGIIRTGRPLPQALADAPWGKALPNGLRHAWFLDPHAAEYSFGTPLKARVLIHNSGTKRVVFRTRNWHQLKHEATDAEGAPLATESTQWLTRGVLLTYRLAPGEFVELSGPGIGIGARGNGEAWKNARVGTWIDAKAGAAVTVKTGPLPLHGRDFHPQLDGEPRWWLDHVRSRLARHLPFPEDAAARLLLRYRVDMELFGTPRNDEAFLTDLGPTALDSLAERLVHWQGLLAWAGPLQSAPTKFRVLPAGAKVAKEVSDPVPPAEATPPPASSSNESPQRNKGADAGRTPPKVEPASLLGFWKGTHDGGAINLSFHRPPADTEIHADLYLGEATIGAPMGFEIAEDGRSVTVTFRGGLYGTLIPLESGTLQLEFAGEQAKPDKIVLTREVEVLSDEPRQKEPRALFAIWKESASPDGTIPGVLVGKLAEAVKEYVKANPTYDSAEKLPKLLHRFDASRDWALADIVSLLDDVAYYATDPIEALMPKD